MRHFNVALVVGGRKEVQRLPRIVENPRVVVVFQPVDLRVVETEFVFSPEKLLADVRICPSRIAVGVKAVGHLQAVHIAVAALLVEHGSARARRSAVDVAHHAVCPKCGVDVVVGFDSDILERNVHHHKEVAKPVVPVVGVHRHSDAHRREVVADRYRRARNQNIGVHAGGAEVLVRNRIHAVVRVVLERRSLAERRSRSKLKSSAAWGVALGGVVG